MRPTVATAVGLCVRLTVLMAAVAGHGVRPASPELRVLAVETVAAKSHWNFMKAALLALARRGHWVTVYTPFPDPADRSNHRYTEVDTSDKFGVAFSAINMDAAAVVPLFARPSFLVPFMANGSRLVCDITDGLLAERFAAESDVGNGFDVFLTEPLSSDCVSSTSFRPRC